MISIMHIGYLKNVSFVFLISFSYLNTIVCNEIKDERYYHYLIAVIQHFKSQKGWCTMEHVTIVNNNRTAFLRVEELFQEKLSEPQEVINLYNKIAELVNCKYAEILNKFFILFADISNECHHFYQSNSPLHFVNCVTSLQDVLRYSKTMFENLYTALTYLSMIDVKIVNCKYTNYSKYIVDELYYCINYVSSMENVNHSALRDENGRLILVNAIDLLQSIDGFCMTVLDVLTTLAPENGNVFIATNIESNLKEIYECAPKNDNTDFVSFLSIKITTLMDDAVNNDFKNLGFLELMNSTSPKLIPPQDIEYYLANRIDVLNYLFQQRGWENTIHISIIYNDHTITANRVIRDVVSVYNFRIKKDHMTLLLKCRYAEILMNVEAILSEMLWQCQKLEARGMNQSYYVCVAEFSIIIEQSKIMFGHLLNVTRVLKRITFWNRAVRRPSRMKSIEKTISEFLTNLETLAPLNVEAKPDMIECRFLADDYHNNFKKIKQIYYKKMHSEVYGNDSQCVYGAPILNVNTVSEFFKNNYEAYNVNPSNAPLDTEYRELFLQFVKFREHIIQDDYLAFGFHVLIN